MKKLIKKLLRESLIKEEIVYHASNTEVSDFNLDNVKGGARARYGWGLYFTNLRHKAELDYGAEGGALYAMNTDNLNILDLNDKVTEEFVSSYDLDVLERKSMIYWAIGRKLKEYIGQTFYNANIGILNSFNYNAEKQVSLFYKQLGYDGFRHKDEYIIFNLENTDIKRI